MFNKKNKKIKQLSEELVISSSQFDAINRSIPMIEFTPDGHILTANSLFLDIIGYSINEVQYEHHSTVCFPNYVASKEYTQFWRDLANGKMQTGQFQRVHKQGHEIWLEATYFPIIQDEKVVKIIKIASDVTVKYQESIAQNSILEALDRSLAIIEFTPQGEIITANGNFLNTVGYSLNEIKGNHHRIFCHENFYIDIPNFWGDMALGQPKVGLFHRKTKSGQDLWLEATYNPIFNASRQVIKVIKFATNVTEQIQRNDAVARASEVAHSTAVETAQIAKQGSDLLVDCVHVSKLINSNVKEAVVQTTELNKCSSDIGNIVSTIKAIAEQTNLLALNAAIEAARAGQNGRGFAVVADEVRMLAAKTAQSTTEIENVVSSNQAITSGVMQSMSDISDITIEGTDKITQITAVMDEIYNGAENVTQTVGELNT
ncbi:hypothetical protein CJF42_06080 [Pseudoalteromonas sp. NBT06-2]|uniref:methyl-accepting chemotaxis protein n=1 Tax=Pseudoalteromonas sp. NBT06-2 TaxID=2025950 RepID=UPI000BA69A45|nr:PAS domain-containing methyl-accepting chemotaxis protein [Pseudoalteromonas sp. NBT06-2]PAJ75216.1 hypothetical protein CJF42_06080 [Pseudoalteromonas sp. NBT06-2]